MFRWPTIRRGPWWCVLRLRPGPGHPLQRQPEVQRGPTVRCGKSRFNSKTFPAAATFGAEKPGRSKTMKKSRRIDRLPASQASAWESGQLVVHDQPWARSSARCGPIAVASCGSMGRPPGCGCQGLSWIIQRPGPAFTAEGSAAGSRSRQHLGWWTQISLRDYFYRPP